jgi:hypothetical protein
MPQEELRPHASALVESLRSMGYTPPAALADLVDNCITAKARNIQILVAPDSADREHGHVSVEDDGEGLSADELTECMRWGGAGPAEQRQADDLGRFGLGMKTASVSMGRVLTVASRKRAGSSLSILRWDLKHVTDSGKWYLLKGADPVAEPIIANSKLGRSKDAVGTIVVTTQLDRFGIKAPLAAQASRNEAAMLKKIKDHLGMVFHRYIEDGLVIRLGASSISPWDPFQGGILKDEEILGGDVRVSSFVMTHHSKLTTADFDRMAGPTGWGAHQGFIIYRAKRLIVPGGWLKLFPGGESFKLARIRIDLPNHLDSEWGLNVMKSRVTPPSWLVADLTRIAEATRRVAVEPFRFRGDQQAPPADANGGGTQAFWNQVSGSDDVRFRINRAHPVVQSLKHSMREPKLADAFLKAFERLLPLEAILQDPKRTTNGSGAEPDQEETKAATQLAKHAIKLLRSQGLSQKEALDVVLASDPFCFQAEQLRKALG